METHSQFLEFSKIMRNHVKISLYLHVICTMHMNDNRHIFYTMQSIRNPCHCKIITGLEIFNDSFKLN